MTNNDVIRFLKIVHDSKIKRCAICERTPDEVREQYPHPTAQKFAHEALQETENVQKSVCWICYFNIKTNPIVIEQIQESPDDEIDFRMN